MEPTYVSSKPKLWLRVEGLVLFITTIVLFAGQHQKWWLYPLLLLTPDIFMVGYLRDKKTGAFLYNLGHSYLLPVIVIFSGWNKSNALVIAIGIIWLGHIGMDRLMGYGLKYDSDFKHTHFGDLNKK